MSEGKRQAVIIGIDEYKDPEIPKLKGALNDANDLCKILKDCGSFEIPDSHFLHNEEATHSAIRKAISDLLWKTDPCDLALFYFSGHGAKDAYEDGYIIPYNMSDDDFFSLGINMHELKKVALNSKNKNNVLVILDCCYSGVSTQDGKPSSNSKISLDQYFEISDEEKEKCEGKIIMASSRDYETSKEKHDCSHDFGSNPHSHGIFTFHLLEGLNGKAGDDPEGSGIITLGNLIKYIEVKFPDIDQRPRFHTTDSSFGLFDKLRIVITPQKHRDYIEKGLAEARKFLGFGDSLNMINAIKEIDRVLKADPKNEKALRIKEEIDSDLGQYHHLVIIWLNKNESDVNEKIPTAYIGIDKISRAEYFNFNRILTLDNQSKNYLVWLCAVSTGQMDFNRFIERCRPYDDPSSMTEPITASLSTSKSKILSSAL